MFGNLFEEEDDDGVSSNPAKVGSSKGGDEPPPPRGRSYLCGIKNQGGTCYLNSLLQTLLFTPEFREELFRLGPEELGRLEDKDQPGAKVRVIPLELQRLFARLLLLDQQSASTADLTGSFGWNSSEGTNQHDVQELNRILFSALENSLVGTSGSTFIHRLYHGTIVNSIVCKECGNVSQRQEDFLDLTMCVCGMSSLEEALWNMFVEEELFEGNNLYRCAQCARLVPAAKSAKLKKLPPFMTMSLLRFSFDFTKYERYKETGRYSFPLTINLKPFSEQTDGEDSDFTYELFSVIIHKGGCYGGHYHVYIKDIEELGKWEPPEEEVKPKIQKVKEKVNEECDSKLQEDDPLAVLTAIIVQEPSQSVLLDQLGQQLLNKTGSSWGKKFRKQYGPIGKFLQSHKDVFMLVSNGARVALNPTISSPNKKPPSPSEKAPNSHFDPPTTSDPDEHLSDEHQASKRKPEQNSHWFDLNDSTVTSIKESEIEKQFQGKESAYMLFYRKVLLLRPKEALNNPQYTIPRHLIQMVQEENVRLQQLREEFDAANNTVELQLHLAHFYRMRNGALQPLEREETNGNISLQFDRRRTIGDLRCAIYQMQELWEGDMALTVAKYLPAGLHLYNTLTDDGVSLYGAGIHSKMDIFVWNGKEVCGVAVQAGAEWEPVLLTVVRPCSDDVDQEEQGVAERGKSTEGLEDGGPVLKREAMGFAGGATLTEVREALGEPEESLLCQEEKEVKGRDRGAGDGGGASGWRVFPPDDMQRTLKELSLKDGDALLVLEPQSLDSSGFTRNGDVVTVTTPSDHRWLQVELLSQLEENEADSQDDRRRVKVPATGSTLLSEVKQRAVEELQLTEQLSGSSYCLRQLDCTGKLLPPVSEELSVRDAGVLLMTTLVLCHGKSPKASQLFLHFSVASAPSTGLEMDIIVERTSTVKECLKAMLDAVGLDGTCWHLRSLDWCEEVGEPLTDEDASLSDLKINSGDTLVLAEGILPPKGFLKLYVWLYNDTKMTNLECNHTVTNSKKESRPKVSMSKEECMNSTLSTGNGTKLLNVGQVEISDEATLDDLKTQLLTLPAFQDMCVPITGFLRVWQLEGWRLARVLKGQQATLRKLKLGCGTDICVQPLQKEEDLGPKQLLLTVKMGIPGERCYYPPEEITWDASHDSSPRSLRTCLAAHFGLCPDSLLLAKHQPEKHTWEEISSWTQQVSKKKKKKKADSLLGAPFYLKDGDTIGVKNPLIDTNRDFVTMEDEQGQQRLREQAEQRRKSGQTVVSSCAKPRKPEMPLSISVGVFR